MSVRSLVDEQAEDEGLWFVAETAAEAYLQQELRRLHAAVEQAFPKYREVHMNSADELLARLVERGGAIVSSGSCSEMEIADARVRGDFYVDGNGLGYVLRMKKWLDKVHERDGYMQQQMPAA